MSKLDVITDNNRTVKEALLAGAPRDIYIKFEAEVYRLTTSGGDRLTTADDKDLVLSSGVVYGARTGVIASGSLKITRKLCTSTDLNFGQCNAAQFEVDLFDIDDVTGKHIEVYEMVEGVRVDLFNGKVDSSKLNPEQNYRHITAYDALYELSQKDVKEWYDNYFAKITKSYYKGDWGDGNTYVTPQVVKYNDSYYKYICNSTDEFIYKDNENREFVENVSQFLVGKTPTEILENRQISKYIERATDFEPYYYDENTIYAFRKALFNYLGIPQIATRLYNDFNMITKTINADTVLFGTLIQNLCQINCCFGHMTPDGLFEFVVFEDRLPNNEGGHTGVETVDYSENYVSNATEYEEYTTNLIDGVRIFNADNVLVSYAGALNAENPLDIVGNVFLEGLSSTRLDSYATNIFNRVKTITYTPISLEALVSLPIDLGSFIEFTSHTGQTVSSIMFEDTCSGPQLVNQTIRSTGNKKRSDPSKISNDLQRAIKNTLDVALVDIYERINENGAMIKRLDANSGSYMVEVKRRDDETGSKFEQTANKISWMIKSGTSASNFTLTDRMAELMANSIDITGLVTFKDKIESGSETVINGGAIKTNTIDGQAIKVSSLTADRFVIAAGQNLLCDVDSFENITEAYAVSNKYGSVQTTITNEAAFVGRSSLKVLVTRSPSYFVLGNAANYTGRVPVEVGKKYAISFYMMSESNGINITVNAYTYINETSGASKSIGSQTFSYNVFNVWKRYHMVVTAQSYTRMGIEFRFNDATAVNKELYIDGIQIEEVASENQLPSPFKAGSLTAIKGGSIITGSITSKQLATDVIKSLNYNKRYPADKYSQAGTFIDLATGEITSTVFFIDKNGNAGFKGAVEATELTATVKGKISIFSFDNTGLKARFLQNSGQDNIVMTPTKFMYNVYDGWVPTSSSLGYCAGTIVLEKSTNYRVNGSYVSECNFKVNSDSILLQGKNPASGNHYIALLGGGYGFSVSNLTVAGTNWGGAGSHAVITGQSILFSSRYQYDPANANSTFSPDVIIDRSGNLIVDKKIDTVDLVASRGFKYQDHNITLNTIWINGSSFKVLQWT